MEMQPGSDCWFHKNEKALPTDYRQCLECGHSYRTQQELIDAMQEGLGPEWTEPIVIEKIFHCPICLHDF